MFIKISHRQFGSGGRTIGTELAKQLGIPCYDQEIIEKIAAESGFTTDFPRQEGHRKSIPMRGKLNSVADC